MNENEKKSARRITRVVLQPTTISILTGWREQIAQVSPCFSASDRDLVSWAVERTRMLSKNQLQEIKQKYFDAVKELENILVQIKAAKLKGDETLVSQLLGTLPKAKSPRTVKARKKDSHESK